MQEDNHIFQGLRRDNHQIRQDAKFLWDAHNIRITNREDNTLLSLTNEKGTSDSLVEFQGYYVGHCVLGKYLVVFTATIDTEGNSTSTHIYRVEKTNLGYDTLTLYEDEGQLNISPNFPIEALGSYENDAVQKVYWVDGRNQPRVINIMKTDGGYNPELLGFVPILNLNETVEITKNYGTGVFAPGVIQYAFTYYIKYGQESNIFWTSPLNYISFMERGASPEDKVSNNFTIVVKNIDTKFDFLRIYSIHRTSINAVPTVLRVVDIPIENRTELTYTDFGETGDTVDPTQLLYIGGESFIAHCITAKDRTLFLGNIEQGNSNYLDIVKANEEGGWSTSLISRPLSLEEESSAYFIKPNSMTDYTAGFKTNETYRCGWQYQLSNGKWSSPIYFEDTVLSSKYPWENNTLTSKRFYLNAFVVNKLKDIGAKKVRPCVVFPTVSDRTVLCQGILCPTVYQYSSRKSSSPYAMSSWYFRPAKGGTEAGGFDAEHNPPDIEFLHNKALASNAKRGAEIQNMYSMVKASNGTGKVVIGNNTKDDGYGNKPTYIVTNVSDISSGNTTEEYFKHNFFIDENIVTFHSPDIELDTSIQNSSLEGLKLNIIGITCLKGTIGDIDIQTSTPAWKGAGFEKVQVGTSLPSAFKYTGGLVTTASYIDNEVPSDHDTETETTQYNYLVYPWHRSGSLNNDQRATVEGVELTRTAVLKTKKLCNFKTFGDNTSLGSGTIEYDITTPQLWNSSELQVLQVETGYSHKKVPYYGNVDTLSTAALSYPIYFAPAYSSDITTSVTEVTTFSTDPVRIKYKSTPHLVFSLESDSDNIISEGYEDYTGPSVTILPKNSSIELTETDLPANEDSSSTNPVVSYGVTGLFKTSARSGYVLNSMIQVVGIDSGYILSGLTKQLDGTYQALLMARDGKVFGGYNNWTSSESTFKEKMKGAIFEVSSGTLVESGNALGLTASNYDTEVTINHVVNGTPVKITAGVYTGESVYLQVTNISGEGSSSYAWALLTLAKITPTRGEDGEIEEGESSTSYPISVKQVPMTLAETPYLLIGELVRDIPDNQKFGGEYKLSKTNNLWYPAGEATSLNGSDSVAVNFTWGDTWYSRYDCLKTYPFTQEDENSVIEIGSFPCETRVNIDGRYDRNRNKVNNLNVTPQIFNLVNEVYTQKDNFFNYRILEDDAYSLNKFVNQVTWSLEKTSASDTDPWTNITLANTLDMDGEKGKVTALRTWNEYLLCFQEKALHQILFNSRVQIPTTDGVPIEISNGYKVDGSRLLSGNIGCSNKWATTTTTGIYFLDSNTDSLYIFNGQLANLSEDRGMGWWVRQNHADKVWNPTPYKGEVLNGVRAFYDNKRGDIYFTPGPVEGIDQPDALCYSEQLGQFTSLMSYGGTQAMFNFADGFYSLRETDGNVKLYQNNVGDYNNFYGIPKGWSFSFISNQNPTLTKIFDTIDLRTDHYWTYGTEQLLNSCPMNYMEVDNEYQHSGTVLLDSRNMRKKFRVWRGLLPRNKGTRQRIRNPWSMITLGWNPLETAQPGDNAKKAVVHDVSVKYTV